MKRASLFSSHRCLALFLLFALTLTTLDVQAQSRRRTSGRTETDKAKRERAEPTSPRRSKADTEKREARKQDDTSTRRRSTRENDSAREDQGTSGRERGRSGASQIGGVLGGTEREHGSRTSGSERTTRRGSTTQSSNSRPSRERAPRVTREEIRVDNGRERTTRRTYEPPPERRREPYREPYRHRPDVRVQPYVRINIEWPWEYRHRRKWRPRYQYQQVIYYEAGWGRHRRENRIDVRTDYHHRVRSANRRRAVVDIYIDRIALYENGRFLGAVDRIPNQLEKIRAVIHRSGYVEFDRDVFLVGDPYAGFELIATRHYDGFLLDAYERGHNLDVGVLDLRRGRVEKVRYSRLFAPYDFEGFVPISLLPEDSGWLCDYGYGSVTAHYYGDDDGYYYGSGHRGRASVSVEPLRHRRERTIRTSIGATIRLERDVNIRRIE